MKKKHLTIAQGTRPARPYYLQQEPTIRAFRYHGTERTLPRLEVRRPIRPHNVLTSYQSGFQPIRRQAGFRSGVLHTSKPYGIGYLNKQAKKILPNVKAFNWRAAIDLSPRIPGVKSICSLRKLRRQVLFARGTAGENKRKSPGQGGTYKRTENSSYTCREVRHGR